MSRKEPQLDWHEGRRRRARELKEQGWKQQDSAAALGVTPGAVSQRLKREREQGVEALRRPARPGSPATAHSCAGRPVVGAADDRRISIRGSRPGLDLSACRRGHPAYVWCHIPSGPREPAAACGRPECAAAGRAATQRDEAAIRAGWQVRWPALKKGRRRGVRHCLDRPVRLLPLANGGARVGTLRLTPVLRVPLTHDHLAAISGITPGGCLFMQTQEYAYHAPDVMRFLRVLLRTLRGKLLVIWNGVPIHRAQSIKDFLRSGAAKRLHMERLPGYAPDLDPHEDIWNYLKRVELANVWPNVCCHTLAELALALRRAKERLRCKRTVIQACVDRRLPCLAFHARVSNSALSAPT